MSYTVIQSLLTYFKFLILKLLFLLIHSILWTNQENPTLLYVSLIFNQKRKEKKKNFMQAFIKISLVVSDVETPHLTKQAGFLCGFKNMQKQCCKCV